MDLGTATILFWTTYLGSGLTLSLIITRPDKKFEWVLVPLLPGLIFLWPLVILSLILEVLK